MGRSHPFERILTTEFKIRIVRDLLDRSSGRLLDIGCGAGFVLWHLGRFFDQAFGVDVDSRALALGRAHVDAGFSVGDAECLPFPDRSFRTVVSTDAFEHIPDDRRAVREIYRVLEPGGACVIYAPSVEGLLSDTALAGLFHDKDDHMLDHRTYALSGLVRLVEDAGLVVETKGYHNVLVQETVTQVLKGILRLLGKEYRHQGEIGTFRESWAFWLYRWCVFPVVYLFVRFEEALLGLLFGNGCRGHRVFVKCRRPETG